MIKLAFPIVLKFHLDFQIDINVLYYVLLNIFYNPCMYLVTDLLSVNVIDSFNEYE